MTTTHGDAMEIVTNGLNTFAICGAVAFVTVFMSAPCITDTLANSGEHRWSGARRAFTGLLAITIVIVPTVSSVWLVMLIPSAPVWITGIGCALISCCVPVLGIVHYRDLERWIQTEQGLPLLTPEERIAALERAMWDVLIFGTVILAAASSSLVSFVTAVDGWPSLGAAAALAFAASVGIFVAAGYAADTVTRRDGVSSTLRAFRNRYHPAAPGPAVFSDPAMRHGTRQRVDEVVRSSEQRLAMLTRRQPRVSRPGFRQRSEQLLRASLIDRSPDSRALAALVQAALTGDVGPIAPDEEYRLKDTALAPLVRASLLAIPALTGVIGASKALIDALRR